MASFFGHIGEYEEKKEDFASYQERLEQWMMLNKITDDQKCGCLISIMGADTYKLLKNLLHPSKPSERTLYENCKILSDYFSPKPIIIAERFKFYTRNQNEGESIASYIVTLKNLSSTCEFGAFLPEALRNRLVCGMKDVPIQTKLLSERDLTFEKAKDLAMSMEMARSDLKLMSGAESDQRIHNVHYKHLKCYRCGDNHMIKDCKMKSVKCFKCKTFGHYASNCSEANSSKSNQKMSSNKQNRFGKNSKPNKTVKYVDTSSENTEEFGVYSVFTDDSGSLYVNINIEGKMVRMQVDTGSAKTLLPESLYEKYWSHIMLSQSQCKLNTYSGQSIPYKVLLTVNVRHDSKTHKLSAFIVCGNSIPLLGRDWMKVVKLNWNIFKIRCSDVGTVLEKNADVFMDGTGVIHGEKAVIHMKDNVCPKFCRARTVPYALRKKVENELDRLEKENVIQKVEHSDWATPIVVVPKTNGVRLCGDFKVTINPNVIPEHYPLPNAEDMFASLNGGKVFSKIDLTHAYQQLEINEASKHHTTATKTQTHVQHSPCPHRIGKAQTQFSHTLTPSPPTPPRAKHIHMSHTPPTPLTSTSPVLDKTPEPRVPLIHALTATTPRTHMQHKQKYMHHSHRTHNIGYYDNLTNRPRTTTGPITPHKHTGPAVKVR